MFKSPDLTDMLVSKIFHDLSGPITAVSNGVELLEDSHDIEFTKKATNLISTSSSELVHQVNFYRFIYGRNNTEGEIDFDDIKKLTDEFFKYSKIQIKWPKYSSEKSVINLTALSSRLLINLIYLAATTLITGGEIEVELQKNKTGKHIKICAQGSRLKVFEHIIQLIDKQEACDVKIDNVQTHLVLKLANALKTSISLHNDNEKLTLVVDL